MNLARPDPDLLDVTHCPAESAGLAAAVFAWGAVLGALPSSNRGRRKLAVNRSHSCYQPVRQTLLLDPSRNFARRWGPARDLSGGVNPVTLFRTEMWGK
jgi:hypothetical protein